MAFKGTSENSGKAFLRGQRRMLVTTIIGYTLSCFLRKNLSLAMPGLAQDYGITKSSLGLFLTLHGVVYGLGNFVCGPLSDRSRPRRFLMGGLALANVVFGFSPVLAALVSGGSEGAEYASALTEAARLPEEEWPLPVQPDYPSEVRNAAERAHDYLVACGEELHIDAALFANRAQPLAFVDDPEVPDNSLAEGWRFETVGRTIIERFYVP